MNARKVEFELDGGTIELDVQWSYEYEPARLNGDPEFCHPAHEDCEVIPPGKEILRRMLMAHAAKQVDRWIMQIQGDCSDMEFHNKPREWAEEDA